MNKNRLLSRLVKYQAETRELHQELAMMFGVPFPVDQLGSIIDTLLKVGSEGQAKGFSSAKKAATKTKAKISQKIQRGAFKHGALRQAILAAMDGTPRTGREILARVQKNALPTASGDQVVKGAAQLFLSKQCRRKGERGEFRYYK